MEEFLTKKEVMAMLKISEKTLWTYRMELNMPYYKLGNKVLFKESEIVKWIEEHKQSN